MCIITHVFAQVNHFYIKKIKTYQCGQWLQYIHIVFTFKPAPLSNIFRHTLKKYISMDVKLIWCFKNIIQGQRLPYYEKEKIRCKILASMQSIWLWDFFNIPLPMTEHWFWKSKHNIDNLLILVAIPMFGSCIVL